MKEEVRGALFGLGLGELWHLLKRLKELTPDQRRELAWDDIQVDLLLELAVNVSRVLAAQGEDREEWREFFASSLVNDEVSLKSSAAGLKNDLVIIGKLDAIERLIVSDQRFQTAGLDSASEENMIRDGVRDARARTSPETRRAIIRAAARKWDGRRGRDVSIREFWYQLIRGLTDLQINLILQIGPTGKVILEKKCVYVMTEESVRRAKQMIDVAKVDEPHPPMGPIADEWLKTLTQLASDHGSMRAVVDSLDHLTPRISKMSLVQKLSGSSYNTPFPPLEYTYELGEDGKVAYEYIKRFDGDEALGGKDQ